MREGLRVKVFLVRRIHGCQDKCNRRHQGCYLGLSGLIKVGPLQTLSIRSFEHGKWSQALWLRK
jgi:hypothetical protein